MQNKQGIEEVYERNISTVYRVCLMYLKCCADVDDAVQNTFLKFLKSNRVFENREHEKAWLIIAAGSVCKNMLKTAWRRKVTLGDENLRNMAATEIKDEVLECVTGLPHKYKTVVYMHYYEGYSGREIAEFIGSKESTVFSLLHRGRATLGRMLKEAGYEY